MSNKLHQAQSHDVLRSWQSQRNDINHHKDFVLPIFIGNNDDSIEPIESMPDVYRYGCSSVIEYLEPLVHSYGLRAVLLFPVITKTDQANLTGESSAGLTNLDDEDADDVDSDGDDTISSSNSSNTQSTSESSETSEDDERAGASVLPERLLPVDESITNSQNPFLNEGEEAHLLDETDRVVGEPLMLSRDDHQVVPDKNLRKMNQSMDVKLIKGMALKDKYNPVLRLIPRLRTKFPQLLIICDVCLCAFTSTGHCCLFEDTMQKTDNTSKMDYHSHHLPRPTQKIVINPFPISNKITCQYLARLSVEYALRGCNVIAPSDMMDGRIETIRELLDENKLQHVSILSYSAKFASAFYGPFRQATNNAPEFGDRRAYQLPPGSRAMAMKAVQRDIDQGADFLMVKPGCPYLDIVRDIREAHSNIPIAIYQVSGEYSMLKLAAKANVIDLKLAVNELFTSFRRAGATIIISYFTPDILRGDL